MISAMTALGLYYYSVGTIVLSCVMAEEGRLFTEPARVVEMIDVETLTTTPCPTTATPSTTTSLMTTPRTETEKDVICDIQG